MSLETYSGLECSICGRDDFRDVDEFRNHEDPDGVRCPGGSSDA